MGSASSCFLSTKPQDEGERSFRSMNDSLRPNITALSTKDIYLIRSSWRGLETCNSLRQPNCSSFKMNSSYVKDRFQGLFFSKLFCHSPDLVPLFESEVSQKRFLIPFVTCIVNSCENIVLAREKLENMAFFYSRMGLKPKKLSSITEVFLSTLADALEHEYSNDIHWAWLRLYGSVLQIMLPVSESLQ